MTDGRRSQSAATNDDAAPTGLMSLAHRMGEGGRRPGEGFSFDFGFYKYAAPDGAGNRCGQNQFGLMRYIASGKQTSILGKNLNLEHPANRGMTINLSGGRNTIAVLVCAAFVFVQFNFASAQSWTKTIAPEKFWFGVACSAGGNKLVAANNIGPVNSSIDFGATWTNDTSTTFAGQTAAASADGRVLVAGGNFTWVSTNSGATWTSIAISATSVASSADGSKLVIVKGGSSPGQIYISGDSGVHWSVTSAPLTNWSAVASSADGCKLVATVGLFAVGPVFTSTNSGATWTPMTSTTKNWNAVASSADGNKLVAADHNSRLIYTSTNSGASWIATSAPNANWQAVASSADGSKLVAVVWQGSIYSSTDSGATWTTNNAPSSQWTSVATAADGNKMVAVIDGGGVYTWKSPTQSIPTLNIVRSGDGVLISWPFFMADYALEQSADLKTTNWTADATIPIITNMQCQVNLTITNGSRFYRLRGY